MAKRTNLPALTLTILILCLTVALGASQTHAAWLKSPSSRAVSLTVCGTLPGDTTWTLLDSPVVVECDVIVQAAHTLTIQPGVVVKFQEAVDELLIYGRLVAVGTPAQPVVFTSLKDDTHGGDTNGDGSASSAAPGDWGGIRIFPGSFTSELAYTWIGYGGSGSNANLDLRTSQVEIHDNTVAYSSWAGILIKGVAAGVPLEFVNNQFISNTVWPVFGDPSGLETSMLFSGNSSQGSPYAGFGLYGALDAQVTYTGQPDFPIVVEGDLVISSGAALTLTPGTVVKFQEPVDDIRAYGRLTAVGSEAQPIVFTSLKDDAHGGDTNQNGSASSPAPGDWGSIYIYAGAAGSRIENAWIGYGGSDWYGLVYMAESNAVLKNSRLLDSSTVGVRVENAAPSIFHNLIADAAHYGVYVRNNGQPQLRENVINGNLEYGVFNDNSALEVDAMQNYWGSPVGPYHTKTNPYGTGDRVSDKVLYAPWLEQPPADLLLLDEVLVGIKGGTWFHPGETTQIQVFYSNLTNNTIQDAVLVARLPMVATYEGSSAPEGIYWPARHEVFWKLGTVAPGESGTYLITLNYLWGLPDEFHDGSAVLFAGSNQHTDLFNVQPYLDYVPVIVSGRQALAEAEVTTLRQAIPALETLYSQAIADGFLYGIAYEYTFQTGTPQSQISLLHPERHALRLISVEDSQVYAITFEGNLFSITDSDGGMAWDLETNLQTYLGAWADPENAAICNPQAGGCCLKNCLKTGLGKATIGRLSALANAGFKTLTCFQALDSGDLKQLAECADELTDAIPIASEFKTVLSCVHDCSGETSAYDCTEDHESCDKTIFGNLHVYMIEDYYWLHKCENGCLNTSALRWVNCAIGDRCVEGVGCVDCSYNGVDCHNNEFNRAIDPNALYGPSGDLLAGQWVTYTIEYENMGAGAAEGVFVVDVLSEHFDDSTLTIEDGGKYYSGTHMLSWYIGQLAPNGEPGSGGQVSFSVQVKNGLTSGTEISNQAVVHFPSVPEVTPTNLLSGQIAALAATPQTLQAESSQPLDIQLSGTAGGSLPLTYELVDEPAYGVLSGIPPAVSYTSMSNYTGPDRFSFQISSGGQTSAPAEVLIQVGPWSGDTTPPEILWTDPAHGASGVTVSATPVYSVGMDLVYAPAIRVQFNEAVAPASLSQAVAVKDSHETGVPVLASYDGLNQRAVIFPLQALNPDEVYTVAMSGVEDLLGNVMSSSYSWWFDTGAGQNQVYLPVINMNE